jgi:hypothetical protein
VTKKKQIEVPALVRQENAVGQIRSLSEIDSRAVPFLSWSSNVGHRYFLSAAEVRQGRNLHQKVSRIGGSALPTELRRLSIDFIGFDWVRQQRLKRLRGVCRHFLRQLAYGNSCARENFLRTRTLFCSPNATRVRDAGPRRINQFQKRIPLSEAR